MPQVWLDYNELASFFDTSAKQAEIDAIARGWSRRKSRDGLTRVKLPEQVARDFMASEVLGVMAALQLSKEADQLQSAYRLSA